MIYLQTVLTTLFSLLSLWAITRLIGYRQLSQMSLFDYINGITIGSIAAELATAQGEEFFQWAIALLLFGGATLALSLLSDHFITLRRGVSGKSLILLQNGKLYDENFKKARLDLSEFLMQCRNEGYFDLSQVDTVLFEPNGRLSILPKSENRPATPADLGAAVPRDAMTGNVILDGQVMEGNLTACGFDLNWLHKELRRQNCTDLSRIFLAICSPDGTLTLFRRGGKKEEKTLE